MLLVIFLALMMGRASGSLQGSVNGVDMQRSSLTDRMERLERLLLAQNAKLSRQETLLRQQDSLIRQQEAKLSRQESLLHQHEEKLIKQENINHKQEAKLTRQNMFLSQCRSLISTLGLDYMGSQSGVNAAGTAHEQSLATLKKGTMSISNDTTAAKLPIPNFSRRQALKSAFHNVMARADDLSLETVVDQVTTRMTQLTAEVEALKNSNEQQGQDLEDARTSTYVHWGNSRCSDTSQLIYSGLMGGSWYREPGAATNVLCLTQDPVPRTLQGGGMPFTALLYGVEFQTHDSNHNKDPVCSVCRSPFSTTIMIPGTDACTAGWQLQYSGFLMAGNHVYEAATQYICMDSRMEARPNGDHDANGRLLDYTVTRCGSLPCGPYINNTVVTCAVCSK